MKSLTVTNRPLPLPRRRNRSSFPTEPLIPGPRRMVASARDMAQILERDPALWPGLTTCVTDTDGQSIVHYAAARNSDHASSLFGPDGVVARWRAELDDPKESRRERRQGREHVVTLRGKHSGYPVTVLFTVLEGT